MLPIGREGKGYHPDPIPTPPPGHRGAHPPLCRPCGSRTTPLLPRPFRSGQRPRQGDPSVPGQTKSLCPVAGVLSTVSGQRSRQWLVIWGRTKRGPQGFLNGSHTVWAPLRAKC